MSLIGPFVSSPPVLIVLQYAQYIPRCNIQTCFFPPTVHFLCLLASSVSHPLFFLWVLPSSSSTSSSVLGSPPPPPLSFQISSVVVAWVAPSPEHQITQPNVIAHLSTSAFGSNAIQCSSIQFTCSTQFRSFHFDQFNLVWFKSFIVSHHFTSFQFNTFVLI